MQNILEIKEKMEEQEKVAYGIANARLLEEQEKLQKKKLHAVAIQLPDKLRNSYLM